jgi:hypothetical protein
MRPQVMRPTAIAALVLSASFISGHEVNPAVAADPRVDAFRIVFPEGSSTPHQTGEHAERNRSAVQHIARVLAHWGGHPSTRFVFVASRPGTCGAASPCNPDHILWQRLNETAALLRSAAAPDRKSIPFHRLGQAFQDEFLPAPDLLPTPVGSSAIDLRIYLDTKTATNLDCPWQFLLFHPDLPPVIGETDGKPVIPIAASSSLATNRNAVISSKAMAKLRAPQRAIWENERGEFAKAAPSIFSADGTSIPAAAARLHVIAAPTDDREWQGFLAKLGLEFRQITPVPTSLQSRFARSAAKGIGDDVQALPTEGITPSPPERLTFAQCYLTFPGASPTERDSSR